MFRKSLSAPYVDTAHRMREDGSCLSGTRMAVPKTLEPHDIEAFFWGREKIDA